MQNNLLCNCPRLPDDKFNCFLLRWRALFKLLPSPAGTATCKQHFRDAPYVESSFVTLLASQPDENNQACLLAAAALNSGDWLQVLPISSCGLSLDDAIRIVIGLRLGANFYNPHISPCGTFVNSCGTHGLSRKRGLSKLARHAVFNKLIHHALVRVIISSILKPAGLSRSDGKRPDGLTLVSWSTAKSIIGNVTVDDTLTFWIRKSSKTAGGEVDVTRKGDKYIHCFVN